MFNLHTDVYLSRRQRMCHILDEDGTLRWSGKPVDAALNWLFENGQSEVKIIGENFSADISIQAVRSSTEPGEPL